MSTKRARQWCCSHKNIQYFEISSKEDINVKYVFEMIARNALDKLIEVNDQTDFIVYFFFVLSSISYLMSFTNFILEKSAVWALTFIREKLPKEHMFSFFPSLNHSIIFWYVRIEWRAFFILGWLWHFIERSIRHENWQQEDEKAKDEQEEKKEKCVAENKTKSKKWK